MPVLILLHFCLVVWLLNMYVAAIKYNKYKILIIDMKAIPLYAIISLVLIFTG